MDISRGSVLITGGTGGFGGAMLAQQIVEDDFLNGTTIRIDGGQRF